MGIQYLVNGDYKIEPHGDGFLVKNTHTGKTVYSNRWLGLSEEWVLWHTKIDEVGANPIKAVNRMRGVWPSNNTKQPRR